MPSSATVSPAGATGLVPHSSNKVLRFPRQGIVHNGMQIRKKHRFVGNFILKYQDYFGVVGSVEIRQVSSRCQFVERLVGKGPIKLRLLLELPMPKQLIQCRTVQLVRNLSPAIQVPQRVIETIAGENDGAGKHRGIEKLLV